MTRNPTPVNTEAEPGRLYLHFGEVVGVLAVREGRAFVEVLPPSPRDGAMEWVPVANLTPIADEQKALPFKRRSVDVGWPETWERPVVRRVDKNGRLRAQSLQRGDVWCITKQKHPGRVLGHHGWRLWLLPYKGLWDYRMNYGAFATREEAESRALRVETEGA